MNSIYSTSPHLSAFNQFVENNPDWKNKYHVYKRDSGIYQRIKCVWEDGDKRHEYHATINVKNGDIYLDCRRRKIFVKNVLAILGRPLYTAIKTAWHLTFIPVALEVFGDRDVKVMANSMKDIIRTPIYGVAMTVISVAAVIFAAVSPNSLYTARNAIGLLERRLHRTERPFHAAFSPLTPCFSPVRNIASCHGDKLEIFAIYQIDFRMNTRALFNDCCYLHPEDQVYISKAASLEAK